MNTYAPDYDPQDDDFLQTPPPGEDIYQNGYDDGVLYAHFQCAQDPVKVAEFESRYDTHYAIPEKREGNDPVSKAYNRALDTPLNVESKNDEKYKRGYFHGVRAGLSMDEQARANVVNHIRQRLKDQLIF